MKNPRLEDLIRPDRLLSAMHTCENGVRWKASVQRFEVDTLRWAAGLRNDLRDGIYRSKGFRCFDIVERGKPRHIQAVHISERTAQKLFCLHALTPVIGPRLIYDNSASQAGKGTEFALKRLVEHLRWHLARNGRQGFDVIMDYHGFFDSIPHKAVIDAMTAGQTDPRICCYIADFVNAFDGDRGLGLGSETSQVGAACYPTPIDKFAKEVLRVHCYARYNDDSYMILPTRAEAEHCLQELTRKAAEYGLEVHPRKTKIHNLASDDFVFLKKRVHITDTGRILLRLTRANISREEKRIRVQRAEYDAGRMDPSVILQSYQCWRSYAQKYNAYGAVSKMDTFFTEVMGDALGPDRTNYGHPRSKRNERKRNAEEATDSAKD